MAYSMQRILTPKKSKFYKISRTIIFVWTIICFEVDLYFAIDSGIPVVSPEIIGLVLIEVLVCWIGYRMVKNDRWALILTTIYYAIRTFNFRSDDFSFYTKNGLNFEVSFYVTGIGEIGINVVTLVFLIWLITDLRTSRFREQNS